MTTTTTTKKHRRRGNGEGTIRKRTDGRWEAKIIVGYARDGKPIYKSVYAHTRAETVKKLDEVRADLRDGLKIAEDITISNWCDIWYQNYKGSVEASTYEGYRYTLGIIKRLFGDECKLREIKTLDIEKALRELREEGYSDSNIKKVRGMMYQIFSKAAASDLIRKNPVADAAKMRAKNTAKAKETFTDEEIRKIMTDLPDDRWGWSIRLLIGSGMRLQELLALEKQHIEPDGSLIHVRQAIKREKGTIYVGPPKSRSGYRDIVIPKSLRPVAVKLRETETTRFLWHGISDEQPYDPDNFRMYYKKQLEKIGVRPLNPHEARHTYVSEMQAAGVDIETISYMTGHADIDMTEHYLHLRSSVMEAAAKKLDKSLTAK